MSYNPAKCPLCTSERLGESTSSLPPIPTETKLIFKEMPKPNHMGYFQFKFCLDCMTVIG
jgi:hypothetical protein